MDLSQWQMNVEDITAKIVESSLKACAVSVGVASLGYLTVKGVQALFSNHHGKRVYPPGPPRGPLIGAMRSFPKGHFAKAFSEWAVTYGDIVYAPLPGMEIVILNSVEVAQELLNKKRNTTARRQVGYLVMNLMGWHWALSLVQPGIHHSNQRKYLRRAIGAQGIASHEARIEAEVTKLMPILSTFEGNPNDHMQQCIGHMVSKATYGEQIWREIGKDLARWNIEAMDIIGESLFSFWLVDVFHFLRFIPDWVPGLRFKQIIKEGNDLAEKVRYRVYNRGLELHQAGKLEHCILRELLEVYGPNVDVQDATATLYTGASDTTTGGIIQFIFCLFLFRTLLNGYTKRSSPSPMGLDYHTLLTANNCHIPRLSIRRRLAGKLSSLLGSHT